MMSKQLRQLVESAIANGQDITVIRNTTANGADYYIGPEENTIVIYNTSSYTQNVFLPAVGETKGKIVSIIVPDFGGGGTIADQDDSLTTWADLTNDADNEFAIVFNTGLGWVTLSSDM